MVIAARLIHDTKRPWRFMEIHNHGSLMPCPPVAAAGCVAIAGAGFAMSSHLVQEAGQAGTATLPLLVAAQGLHTAEGLRWGG